MFSKSCEYRLRPVIFRAKPSYFGGKVNVTTILKAEDFPPAFKAKILVQMAKCNLFESVKSLYNRFFIVRETRRSVFLKIRKELKHNTQHHTESVGHSHKISVIPRKNLNHLHQ
ncbi:hypothetical protein BXY82_2120 [Gelidibacter sediminis]|uniref:Uncharacterized protein n=1 Tax=Gelidibacter sediminis TaxID=1608710 RepID=A0A4R7Q0W9_9FLAO|nr:hypothetical protein [Gelidibacter sediminis]TDU40080.1 hypothetical protein BXY82_2120 [Gelidibacter sediminis]